jgi:hypothetical protein
MTVSIMQEVMEEIAIMGADISEADRQVVAALIVSRALIRVATAIEALDWHPSVGEVARALCAKREDS